MARRRAVVDGPALNQMSVYMLRADVPDVRGALNDPDGLERFPVDADAGLAGALFVKQPEEQRPTWLPFLSAVAARPLPEHKNQHVSAVLFLERGGRTFALTFGFGRHLLDPEALEPDFGLRVAAGLVDPEAINVVDSRLVQATRIQVRRQAGRGTTSRTIGVDLGREMLRALSGQTLDEELGTRVTGSDALGLAATVDVPGLLDRLDVFRDVHERNLYRERFPLLDRWQAVTDPRLRAELDAGLLDAFARRDRRLEVSVPEVIDWRGAGFSFTRERRGTRHAFPSVDDYLATLGGAPTLDGLRSDRLTLHSADDDVPNDAWRVHRALEWETVRGDRVYFLTDGKWYVVAADFLAEVDARLERIDRSGLPAPAFDPREWERDYNERLAAHQGDRVLLDRQFAYFEDESGKVEVCDVFTGQREFVHVKRDFDTEAVSLMLGQGSVSADLFMGSPRYRARLRELLAARQDLAALVPAGMPDVQAFRVAYGIISSEAERVPMDMPVFARIYLSQVADMIARMGMRLTVFGIPVRAGSRPDDLGPTEPERRAAARAGAAADRGD